MNQAKAIFESLKLFIKKIDRDKIFMLTENRLTFLFFFSMAAFFWFLLALSKEYTTTIQIKTHFIHSAPNKIINSNPNRIIPLNVKAKGFDLLSYNLSFFQSDLKIDLAQTDLNKANQSVYVLGLQSIRSGLDEWLNNRSLKIMNIAKDTLIFNLDFLIRKKVPVLGQYNLDIQPSYMLSQAPLVSPDSIVIFGPQQLIQPIEHIETKPISKKQISQSFQTQAELNLGTEIDTEIKKVNVHFFITQFSEKKLIIPIRVVNKPLAIEMKTFPSSVEVFAVLPLDSFDLLTDTDFDVFVDYKHVRPEQNILNIKTISAKKFVKSYKISPDKVEYIIIENQNP